MVEINNIINDEKIKAMLLELDKIYIDINKIQYDIIILNIKHEDLKEKKELLEEMLMYSYNKLDRKKDVEKWSKRLNGKW